MITFKMLKDRITYGDMTNTLRIFMKFIKEKKLFNDVKNDIINVHTKQFIDSTISMANRDRIPTCYVIGMFMAPDFDKEAWYRYFIKEKTKITIEEHFIKFLKNKRVYGEFVRYVKNNGFGNLKLYLLTIPHGLFLFKVSIKVEKLYRLKSDWGEYLRKILE